MSKKSPNVIFKSKFCLALTSRDNNNSSLNYKEQRLKDVDDMIDYFSDERKKAVNMFEYFMGHTRGEKYNLVLENGSYATKKDIKRIKNEYKKYIENSNLWKGVISFKKEYLDENIDLKTLEDKIAKEVLPQFLKYCGFKDIKNMSYVFSIHTNRKHQPHIHFAFIEKKPNFLYCDNRINYRRKGKINLDEQNYLKRLVELVIEREKYYTPCLKKTNEDIDYLKSYFKPTEKNYILNNINDICLVHTDIWDGNILIKNGKVSGIVDFSDLYFGDEIMTFYFHTIDGKTSESFLNGFNNKKLNNDEKIRIEIYRLYVILKMIVDCELKQYGKFGWMYKNLDTRIDSLQRIKNKGKY